MKSIEKLQEEIRLWKGLNNYIVQSAMSQLRKRRDELKPRMSEKELYDLKKAEQVKLLKSFGVDDIPRYERQRVALLLKLGA